MKFHTFLYASDDDIVAAVDAGDIDDSSAVLVQVYAAAVDPAQLRVVLAEIRYHLPCCKLIGITTTALVHNGSIVEQGILVSISQFDDSELALTYEAFPADEALDWYTAGLELASKVVDDNPRLLLCFAAGAEINAEELARGLTTDLGDCVLGGALASADDLAEIRVVAGDNVFANGIVVVAISGECLNPAMFNSEDWMMLGTPMEVTAARGNVVQTINYKPADDVYSQYLGQKDCENMASACVRFPLLLKRNGSTIARLGNRVDEDGAIHFWGNLRVGESVRFGLLNPVATMEQISEVENRLKERPGEAVFVFLSEARKRLMRSVTKDELARLQVHAPVNGVFTTGQFFYTPERPDYLHYAQTLLCLSEGEKQRSVAESGQQPEVYSPETMQLRAMMHLVNTTARELESANRELEELANTDALTRVYNRHKATQLIEQEILRAQRYSRPFALILIDIDDFKHINDQFGHQVGDRALVQLAAVAKALVRQTDAFARWGGEEFVVVCPETSLAGAAELAERLRAAVEEAEVLSDTRLTISLGVTQLQPEEAMDELYSRVDKALYASKDGGKNRVTVL